MRCSVRCMRVPSGLPSNDSLVAIRPWIYTSSPRASIGARISLGASHQLLRRSADSLLTALLPPISLGEMKACTSSICPEIEQATQQLGAPFRRDDWSLPSPQLVQSQAQPIGMDSPGHSITSQPAATSRPRSLAATAGPVATEDRVSRAVRKLARIGQQCRAIQHDAARPCAAPGGGPVSSGSSAAVARR